MGENSICDFIELIKLAQQENMDLTVETNRIISWAVKNENQNIVKFCIENKIIKLNSKNHLLTIAATLSDNFIFQQLVRYFATFSNDSRVQIPARVLDLMVLNNNIELIEFSLLYYSFDKISGRTHSILTKPFVSYKKNKTSLKYKKMCRLVAPHLKPSHHQYFKDEIFEVFDGRILDDLHLLDERHFNFIKFTLANFHNNFLDYILELSEGNWQRTALLECFA